MLTIHAIFKFNQRNPPLVPVPNLSPKPRASLSILFLVLSSINRPPKDISLPWSHIPIGFSSSSSFLDVLECRSISVDPRTFRCGSPTSDTKTKQIQLRRLTVCSSTPLLISSSIFRFFLASKASSSVGSAFDALFFFPDTSSANRCCRSAGVSVHRELSTFLAGAAVRANCRALSFVGSRAIHPGSQQNHQELLEVSTRTT